MSSEQNLPAHFGEFVVALDLQSMPPRIVERARALLLNGYAIGLGARDSQTVSDARDAARLQGLLSAGGATILGLRTRVNLTAAMQANATLLHARVQDDTLGSSHFGTVVIPTLTAMAEAGESSMTNFLPALVAGYEVGGALDRELTGRVTAAGFRGTMVFGTIAAAASAARFLGLPAHQIATAIGMAASFTGGTLQSFVDGTDEWRFQPAVAATLGYAAATFAASGATASVNSLDGLYGLSGAFAGAAGALAEIPGSLGREWEVERVRVKPFPVAMFNQSVVHAAQTLRGRIADLQPVRISVELHPFEAEYPGIALQGPFESSAGASMSAPRCVALTLVDGAPTLANLENNKSASVAALAALTAVVAAPSLERLACRLIADCADGSRFEVAARTAPSDAFDMRAAQDVLHSICKELAIPIVATDGLRNFVKALPHGDINDVVDAFAMGVTDEGIGEPRTSGRRTRA